MAAFKMDEVNLFGLKQNNYSPNRTTETHDMNWVLLVIQDERGPQIIQMISTTQQSA